MKRTKMINSALFSKNWSVRHFTPVVLAISTMLMLSSCEKSDETFSLYQNADDYLISSNKSSEYDNSYHNTSKNTVYDTTKDKIKEEHLTKDDNVTDQQTQIQPNNTLENQTQSQSNGEFWMPLIAGYMMGKSINSIDNCQHKPIFSSNEANHNNYDQHKKVNNKNHNIIQSNNTAKVFKNTTPSKTTTTITRGGFGELGLKRQSFMQRGNSILMRSMGG